MQFREETPFAKMVGVVDSRAMSAFAKNWEGPSRDPHVRMEKRRDPAPAAGGAPCGGASGPRGVYFVSGIDTGIGKTVVTGLLARWLAARGVDAITFKLVQTGNEGFSEVMEEHRRICGGRRFPEDDAGRTAPQIFRFPSSPMLSASLEGRTVDLAAITRAVDEVSSRHAVTLVESAGGLDVPLTEDTLSIDYAAARGWPLVLVTCGRLGSINHALLSVEAALRRGMRVAGVIHNWCDGADPAIDADAVEAVRRRLAAWGCPPVVVRVPRVSDLAAPPDVDFSEIFA